MSDGLHITSPGLHTTVQDMGRFGFQDQGVPTAGALDVIGLRLANALVGNRPDEACLEISYLGPTFRVTVDSVRVAIVGKVKLSLNDGTAPRVVDSNRSLRLKRGDVLIVGAVTGSSTAYLAVEGGFDLAPVMGSLSTYQRASLGPLGGQPLAVDTVLPLRQGQCRDGDDLALRRPMAYDDGPIRVILGPQHDAFTDDAVAALLEAEFVVSKEADRMGLRLDGPTLRHRASADIPSDGLVNGCIQVPGNGKPIILLADHQTVGGYAKIATVISADLPRLGRAVPGTPLRFIAVSVPEAEAIRRALEQDISRAVNAMTAISASSIDLDALYDTDLVSGVVDAISGVGR